MTGTSSTRPSAETGSSARVVNIRDSIGVVVGDNNKVIQKIIERRKAPAWPQQIGLVPPTRGFLARDLSVTLDVAAVWGSAVIVTGMGGVGKTQLAADFVGRAQPVDLLVWVNAQNPAAIVTLFAEASDRLALGPENEDSDQAARRFLSWLATSDQRWLIVLNDLSNPADVGELWPPQRPTGCAIVTTRRRDAALLARGTVVELGVFSPVEAVAFLNAQLGSPAGAAELAEDLGYLPLALGHAAAYMRDLDLTCDDYRRRLSDGSRRLADLFPERDTLTFDGHQETVATTWSISIEAADAARPARLARPLLELASFLDANGIPQDVFSSTAAVGWISTRTGMPTDTIRADDCNDAIRVLNRFNLAIHEPSQTGDRWLRGGVQLVHALVQRAVRESLANSDADAAAKAAADAVAEIWPINEESKHTGELLRANTFALQRHQPDALWSEQGPHQVLTRTTQSFGLAALIPHAIDYAGNLCDEAAKRLGTQQPATFTLRSELARWQGDVSNSAEALKTLEQVVADGTRLLAPDHPIVLEARENLGYQRGQAGDPAAAVADLTEVIDDLTKVHGASAPKTLDTRNRMAYWMGKGGDANGAVLQLQALLPEAQSALAPSDRIILSIRHNLGYWLGEAGDPAAAAAALQDVLDDAQRILGAEDRELWGIRSNLAYWRGEAGDLEGAATALNAELGQRIKTFGTHHRDTLATWHGLIHTRIRLGQLDGAAEALERIVQIRTELFGSHHPETLSARHDLACLRGELGDAAAAVAGLKAELRDRETSFNTDHRAIAVAREALALWQRRLDESTSRPI